MTQRAIQIYRTRGFTLLELLLVVVILASVAWMLTSTVDDNISQVRYEDTRNRLDAIRTAVLGPNSPATWERGIQSGYVVDNGVLPVNIDALVALPTDYDEYGAVEPIYDQGGANEYDFSGATSSVNYQLFKGHRQGYLPASSSGYFRDGWGTDRSEDGADLTDCPSATTFSLAADLGNDIDSENHGWCVSRVDSGISRDGWYVDSYGMDGGMGELTGHDYETDMLMGQPILNTDWQIDISGASVRIENMTGDMSFSSNHNFSAALLVYTNDDSGDGPTWETVPSSSVSLGALANGADFVVNFPASTRIPVGEHLLILLADDDAELNSITEWTAEDLVAKRVKFFSRGGVPELVLEIR
ncbi:prepilin-type N-terminal cleavage/methylation domain-containing protein [Cerasicoccus frondis]|uniref:prepilin-type N-terminal cleavage/methylation domain-containing protein n=1 Tax=Cerasicoccus frondis TaxID=490090 RepID=UPI002852B074|nr:prepilin-type N-terminal cleavage/methylation domain-containing protein [Cerasicoccus frondis]